MTPTAAPDRAAMGPRRSHLDALPAPRARWTARCGITLVEVLATLTLIGIILPAAMYGINASLQAAAWSRHQQEAAMLAELKLSEFLVVRDASLLRGMGDFGEAWPEYRWESDFAAAEFGLYEVHVTVTWRQRGVERFLTLGTLVHPVVGGEAPDDEEVPVE